MRGEITIQRWHLRVTGIVQGVGFRPFVYTLATDLGLTGHVGNDNQGVFIEVEGPPDALAQFVAALHANPPPLAHIDGLVKAEMPVTGSPEFVIVDSQNQAAAQTFVSPDLCLCDACRAELLDPADRRYGYPFINCTNCGPRLTIIRDLPYDRPLTTMAAFPMCPDCEAEYHDPRNRRFHAQPNACPVCGPHIWLEQPDVTDDVMAHARAMLADGQILAIKGVGGFHLACDATQPAAVSTLRDRKRRPAKPLALMMGDVAMVRRYTHLSEAEAQRLTSRERPIVLLDRRPQTDLAPEVAPGQRTIGVMLPYSPLHVLLMDDRPLVMTSANLSGQPLVKDNAAAREQLADIVDGYVMHNRDIETRCDDSVVRVYAGQDVPIRRSRGYAPLPVKLPFAVRPMLAVGGELKATFCVARDQHAILSHHIGDMENLETLDAFRQAAEHYLRLFRVEPEMIVCDMHPDYLSTRWAAEFAAERGIPVVSVQHHHAHIAALMVEKGLHEEEVLGICFDGTGYGPDGTIWGGEVLAATYTEARREMHLKPVPLPGGDAAIKRPYRMALAHLWAAGLDWADDLPCVAAASEEERRILARQLEQGVNTVPTSSMGRLFDAVAALIGLRQTVTYEAQAAMELEAAADPDVTDIRYRFGRAMSLSGMMLDPAPVLAHIIDDYRAGVSTARIAAHFHHAIAAMVAEVAYSSGYETVALSGGVFQNVHLLNACIQLLTAHNLTPLTHHIVPSNDGGLSLGQIAVAAQRS